MIDSSISRNTHSPRGPPTESGVAISQGGYVTLRGTLATFYDEERFAALFHDRLQPTETPRRLAPVAVLR
jgi:hypothetical protein